MNSNSDIISARRDSVLQSYNAAKAENRLRFLEGDAKATEEYIFENQIIDANEIVAEFTRNNRRVISVVKKTKVGMDGLMIEVAKLMTTHPDDNFAVNPKNVRIITGMSNAGWEKDMKEKTPNCFKDNIFHHGQLKKADLKNLKDALIIIDEIDTGDKEYQVLHETLKEAGLLDVNSMAKNNNRFMFASATMIKELYDLYHWGNLHCLYKMTIPANYIGHAEFLQMGIIQEFYPLDTSEKAEKWTSDDIIDHYGVDYRVHIVRVNNKSVTIIQNACIRKGIEFRNHTSTDKITVEEIGELFEEPLTKHIVMGVKGFFRRANLIPNKWKLRIGATHELHTKRVDNNVQIQGLPGRMTGYWRAIIENGHKTGPHRTSVNAVKEYEIFYNDPFGDGSYVTAGFKKSSTGKVSADPTMISVKNVIGLEAVAADISTATVPVESNPIVIIHLSVEEVNNVKNIISRKKAAELFEIIKSRNEVVYNEYSSYIPRGWNIDSKNKIEKYGLVRMNEPGARSKITNIEKEDKQKNVVMIYLHENDLIISAWSGERKRAVQL